MVRALQFTAIGAFMMRGTAQSLMAAAHAAAGRRGLFLRNGHGAGSLSLKQNWEIAQGQRA